MNRRVHNLPSSYPDLPGQGSNDVLFLPRQNGQEVSRRKIQSELVLQLDHSVVGIAQVHVEHQALVLHQKRESRQFS